jgi:hypothetical protein
LAFLGLASWQTEQPLEQLAMAKQFEMAAAATLLLLG